MDHIAKDGGVVKLPKAVPNVQRAIQCVPKKPVVLEVFNIVVKEIAIIMEDLDHVVSSSRSICSSQSSVCIYMCL